MADSLFNTKDPTLRGYIEEVIFYNPENAWSVVRVSVEGNNESVSAVGTMPNVEEGMHISAKGQWQEHETFGDQFKAFSATVSRPSAGTGLARYIATIIPGVGAVAAEKIVKHFGKDTLEVLDKDINRLREINGMGKKRIEAFKEVWAEHEEGREATILLREAGLGESISARVCHFYKDSVFETLKNTPYKLIKEIQGIGFQSADAIAKAVGVEGSSRLRIRAGIDHALLLAEGNGDCNTPIDELCAKTTQLLNVGEEVVLEVIEDRCENGRLIREDDNIYRYAMYNAEKDLAKSLAFVHNDKENFKEINIATAVKEAERASAVSYSEEQSQAIGEACLGGVCIITGGPGVGKTTVIRSITTILENAELKVSLCAPTGRAAKRMEEACGHKASTIHRLLGVETKGYGGWTFKHNEQNPLECDVVIVDEFSMVDIWLAKSLLQALPKDAALIIVGDKDQLPSVGPGQVLRDIINSKTFPCYELRYVFRQEEASRIVLTAHTINEGNIPNLDSTPPEGVKADFYFMPAIDAQDATNQIVSLVTKRLPEHYGFNSSEDIQVLVPMHKGACGTKSLNARLQKILSHAPIAEKGAFCTFQMGDKVLQTSNDYEREIYNGDVGIVEKLEKRGKVLIVNFDGRRVEYTPGEASDLTLAYAMTVHKSQGSEYPCVVLGFCKEHYIMLQRNLLYTALTRGRRLVIIVGAPASFRRAVQNNNASTRRTSLTKKIEEAINTAKKIEDSKD